MKKLLLITSLLFSQTFIAEEVIVNQKVQQEDAVEVVSSKKEKLKKFLLVLAGVGTGAGIALFNDSWVNSAYPDCKKLDPAHPIKQMFYRYFLELMSCGSVAVLAFGNWNVIPGNKLEIKLELPVKCNDLRKELFYHSFSLGYDVVALGADYKYWDNYFQQQQADAKENGRISAVLRWPMLQEFFSFEWLLYHGHDALGRIHRLYALLGAENKK